MEKALRADSASPLYRQLMQRIRADIASGVYAVHSRIPSEAELGETYQVSRVTVRKALAELTREGILRRMQGKGTYVCAPRLKKNLREVTSFHEACLMMGCTPGTKVISAQIVHAEEDDREELGLSGTIAVITSDFHCFRSHLIAQRVGLSVIDIPAKSPYALLNANYYVREAFALGKTLIFD